MRFFNTAGPVDAQDHYCLPPLERLDLEDVLRLIDQKKYFLLHAPRQTGKTTCLLALMEYLNQGGRYRALYVNIENAQAARENVAEGMRAILSDHALQFPHVKRRESMNKALVSCGPPLNFQTHAPEGINLPATIADAVAMGADSVEIWNLDEGGFSTMPLGQLLKLKSLFAPNRAH